MLIPKTAWPILACMLALASTATGQSVTLAWDPNPEADIQRYELSYGPAPGQYDRTIDTGTSTTWNVTGLEEGRSYFFAVRAVNSSGLAGPYSLPISYDAPYEAAVSTASEAARIVIGLSAHPANGGWMQIRADASLRYGTRGWGQLPWPDYNRVSGEMHPATGDVDDDGRDEIVMGFSSQGRGWLVVLDDDENGYRPLRWLRIPWPDYNAAAGATYPAVGDFDGDGRAEIAVGLGPGSHGWMAIFDDAQADFRFRNWYRANWPDYVAGRAAETRPAAADFDGDGLVDLLVGLGAGSRGWMEVAGSTGAGFTTRRWLRAGWDGYDAANGATWPAAGNLDDDPRPEIVVGFGRGSGGWVRVLDDVSANFAHRQWLRVGWDEYERANGETRPAVGNLDDDPKDEILLGLGQFPGRGGWLQLRDDIAAGLAPVRWIRTDWADFDRAGGGTFPAIGRFR